jgi:chromosome segregation ATPase
MIMTGKKFLLVAALFVVAAAAGFAQEQQIPYVDVEKANQSIEAMKAENQKLAAETERLTKENAELEGKIDKSQQLIRKIDPILASVISKSKELYTVNSTIVDANMKAKAAEAIQKNRELRTDLENRRAAAEKSIAEDYKKIDSNRTNIVINTTRTGKNNDNIVILEASISKTKNQLEVMEKYIANVNEFLNKAKQDIGQ